MRKKSMESQVSLALKDHFKEDNHLTFWSYNQVHHLILVIPCNATFRSKQSNAQLRSLEGVRWLSSLKWSHLAGESMKSTFCCEYPCQGFTWLSAVIYQYLIVSLLFPTIILTVFHTNMYKWLPHIFPLKWSFLCLLQFEQKAVFLGI